MNYQHFSIEERCCLRKYYKEGLSFRKIAELLGRSPSTISREIARNQVCVKGEITYYPNWAQKKYRWRRSFCHRGLYRQDQELMEYIDEKLSLTWSPEQISNSSCGMKMPSFKTIYRWIYEGYLKSGTKRLEGKGKAAENGHNSRMNAGRVSTKGTKTLIFFCARNSGIGKRIRYWAEQGKGTLVMPYLRSE